MSPKHAYLHCSFLPAEITVKASLSWTLAALVLSCVALCDMSCPPPLGNCNKLSLKCQWSLVCWLCYTWKIIKYFFKTFSSFQRRVGVHGLWTLMLLTELTWPTTFPSFQRMYYYYASLPHWFLESSATQKKIGKMSPFLGLWGHVLYPMDPTIKYIFHW